MWCKRRERIPLGSDCTVSCGMGTPVRDGQRRRKEPMTVSDNLYDELCPVCGEDLSRIHILVHCKGLELERQVLHRMIPPSHLTDFHWLAQHGEQPLGTFLSMVQIRFAMAGSITVRSSTRSMRSSVE